MTFKKGDMLTNGSTTYVVRRVHRDGTITLEARFALFRGKEKPGYLGHKYRVNPDGLPLFPYAPGA